MSDQHKETLQVCPPCNHDCDEGRNCPARKPNREWIGLTDEEVNYISDRYSCCISSARLAESILKEKNRG